MGAVPVFPEGVIEALAKVLGECGSGLDITRILNDRGLPDNSGESTKWRRLYAIFLEQQRQYKCANRVLGFIQSFLTLARFVGRNEVFEARRASICSSGIGTASLLIRFPHAAHRTTARSPFSASDRGSGSGRHSWWTSG